MKPEVANYYTLKKVEVGEYRSNLNAKDFVGIDLLGKLTNNLKSIVKFVEVSGKFGYYEDILEYRHVTKKGIYVGDKECATYRDAYKLLSDGKDTPYKKDEFKAFFVKKDVGWKSIFISDYVGVDADGYGTNDITLVDKFINSYYNGQGGYYRKYKPGVTIEEVVLLRVCEDNKQSLK